MKSGLLLLLGSVLLAGCNTYSVRPLPFDDELKEVVVVDNPRVIVRDFKRNLEDEFNARGIRVRHAPSFYRCNPDEYVVDYSALQSWDFVTYMADADVTVRRNGVVEASGKYRHVGKSWSLDLFTKWRGTEWKMSPLYRKLLQNYDVGAER